MASKLIQKLIGENHEDHPLMMAWHALTGQLQKIDNRQMPPGEFDRLRDWWDQSDRFLRRIAQTATFEPFEPFGQVGEADILGTPRPGTEPAFTSGIPSGDSHALATKTHKDASELPHDDEETRELKIADAILRAAGGMARSPAVEEIVRQAEELKRIHGVQ